MSNNLFTITYDPSAGIDGLDLNATLFPNPTTGKVMLTFDTDQIIERITLTDLTGRIIDSRESFVAKSVELDLSDEALGIYFIDVKINNTHKTFKISKK